MEGKIPILLDPFSTRCTWHGSQRRRFSKRYPSPLLPTRVFAPTPHFHMSTLFNVRFALAVISPLPRHCRFPRLRPTNQYKHHIRLLRCWCRDHYQQLVEGVALVLVTCSKFHHIEHDTDRRLRRHRRLLFARPLMSCLGLERRFDMWVDCIIRFILLRFILPHFIFTGIRT